MDDALGTKARSLDQGCIFALILDDVGKAVFSDALRGQTLLHVVFKAAHRADVCSASRSFGLFPVVRMFNVKFIRILSIFNLIWHFNICPSSNIGQIVASLTC